MLSDALWQRALGDQPYARALSTPDRLRLRDLANAFLHAKTFEAAAGLKLTELMRATIAIRASIPILNLGLDFYAGWYAVVLYPGDFRVADEYADESGVVHREVRELCGESLAAGPVVLSWQAIVNDAAGHDLVVHECAHKLDSLNGAADGFPPLHSGMTPRRWTEAFETGYGEFCRAFDAGRASRIDSYAATDPAEFFAVLSEYFFSAPVVVYEDFPAIYNQLREFYRQDPFVTPSSL